MSSDAGREAYIPPWWIPWILICAGALLVAGLFWGYDLAMVERCKRDCDGAMHSCEERDCICEGPEGTLYRAEGWEADDDE